MSYMKAAVGGLIGGLVGAAIWAAISWATNYEIGILASVIGAMVGFGVRLGAGEEAGEGYGGLAILLALVSIFVGKYAAYDLSYRSAMSKIDSLAPDMTDDDMIQMEATTIVQARTAANTPMRWPAGKNLDNAETLTDYPADIVQEATTKWNAVPAEEKTKQKEERQEMIKSITRSFVAMSGDASFFSTFNFYDILWVGLAGLAAFKFGSGLASDD